MRLQLPIGPHDDHLGRLGCRPRQEGVMGTQATVTKPTHGSDGTPRTLVLERNPTSSASGERHQNEGHGRRLMLAFEALDAFPALSESRTRLLSVISKDNVATADIVTAVESDVARIIAVMRLANVGKASAERVETVVAAVERLTPQAVHSIANRVRTFDFFERSKGWDTEPERFRLHALATQHTADRLAAEVGYEHRDRLTVTSLLHDVGKLVLMHAYPGYVAQVKRDGLTPEKRIHQESSV